jgi:transcription elongation factor Elf1
MGKEFNRKYMHPTRRKLLDMVHTGQYQKNATIGYNKVEQKREVGEIWEDDHHQYEQKNGFVIKTGKNHEEIKKIRDYLAEKSNCKNENCQTIKITQKDKQFIKQNGYCLGCTVENEHQIRVSGLWQEYQNYKIWTRMILVGKIKLDSYRQSLEDLQEEYHMHNGEGQITETWKLPKPIEEVRQEINELIEYGESEIKELEEKRIEVFQKLLENQLESYL